MIMEGCLQWSKCLEGNTEVTMVTRKVISELLQTIRAKSN